jgi:hypothetical protein
MALKSGIGRSSCKCPLTSNGYHLHSRRCCPHLISFCDVSKKCYRCSRSRVKRFFCLSNAQNTSIFTSSNAAILVSTYVVMKVEKTNKITYKNKTKCRAISMVIKIRYTTNEIFYILFVL